MYAISRNPMYVGLFLLYFAIAIFRHAAWPLFTVVIPFFLLDRIVIPFEERQMLERYGPSYEEYCARVGRWLRLR
jgi:protein-S-isoprenylcysteine O-methyltransferase Ste14